MMLTCALYGIIYMANGKILKFRTCKAYQRRHRADQRAWNRCQCRNRHGRSLPNLQASSIPIYSRSTKGGEQSSHTRFQNYVYREAITRADSANTRLCQSLRTYHKRHCNPGLRKIFTQRPKAWLLENQLPNKSIWNIVLTVYQPKKLCWLTSF